MGRHRKRRLFEADPWISVIPNYKEINTLDREDENSIFSYYRKLIRLRKTVPVLADGSFEALLEEDDRILAYKRRTKEQELYVFCNFFPEEASVDFSCRRAAAACFPIITRKSSGRA